MRDGNNTREQNNTEALHRMATMQPVENTAPSFYDSLEPVTFIAPAKENLFNWRITINYRNYPSFECTIMGVRFDQALEAAEIMVDYLNDVQLINVEKMN